MRLLTALALIGVLVVILLVAVLGATQVSTDTGTLTERWVSDTARDYQANHHPVAAQTTAEGALIVAPINELSTVQDLSDTSCATIRLDSATGRTVWRSGLAAENCTNHALTGPTIADIDDGNPEVLVARGDNTMTVHNATSGEIVWQHPLTSLGYSEPAVGDLHPADGNEVVVVDLSGGLFAVHANGTTAWQRELTASTWANPQIADFDGDDGQEVAVGTGQAVRLYDGEGTQHWKRNVAAMWMNTGQADTDSAQELFVAEGRTVTALDGASGKTVWSREFESITSLHAVGDGDGDGTAEVYVSISGGTLHAVDATDGTTEWTTQFTGSNRVMPPPTLGDVDGDGTPDLIAGTSEGVIAVLNPETGEERATYERDVPIWTYPAVADIDGDGDEDILAIYGDGRVVALSFER